MSLNGSAGVWPNKTTTYTVIAVGPGGTNSASATVTVTGRTRTALPTAASATVLSPILIQSAEITGPGRLQINFTAQAGRLYEIQASTDQRVWLMVGHVTAMGQSASFVAGVGDYQWRFYRVVLDQSGVLPGQ